MTRSRIDAAPEAVWERVTSFEGINDEFGGLFRMTAPREVRERGLGAVRVGERICRSWVLLFGVLPVDYDDITLVELDPPRGFRERSTMLSMRDWEHHRTIEPDGDGCIVTDAIRYEPRLPGPDALPRHLYTAIFRLRHRRLRRHFSPHDYEDLHRVAAPAAGARSAEDWLRAAFEGPPAPVRAGLRLGWRLIGLRLGPYPSAEHVLGWRIAEREPDRVRVEVDGRFGLRAAIVLRREAGAVTFSTRVDHPRALGRLCWLAARPLHPPIVRAALRRLG